MIQHFNLLLEVKSAAQRLSDHLKKYPVVEPSDFQSRQQVMTRHAWHALREFLEQKLEDALKREREDKSADAYSYSVGTRVEVTTDLFQSEGEIRGAFMTKSGKLRYVVEHEPGYLHIYKPTQLLVAYSVPNAHTKMYTSNVRAALSKEKGVLNSVVEPQNDEPVILTTTPTTSENHIRERFKTDDSDGVGLYYLPPKYEDDKK